MGIQFFDQDALLPPPFTFLSVLVYTVQKCDEHRKHRSSSDAKQDSTNIVAADPEDRAYSQLIFQLLDNCKPKPDTNRKRGNTNPGG